MKVRQNLCIYYCIPPAQSIKEEMSNRPFFLARAFPPFFPFSDRQTASGVALRTLVSHAIPGALSEWMEKHMWESSLLYIFVVLYPPFSLSEKKLNSEKGGNYYFFKKISIPKRISRFCEFPQKYTRKRRRRRRRRRRLAVGA